MSAVGWADALPAWYAREGRHHLPWRLTRDPWAVLVSEVMLQQTSVARVLPRWRRFLERWPTPLACARAPLAEVLREWQGLGYPRRARALWETARQVEVSGWPHDEAGLRGLPGIGAYTARALLTFAAEVQSRPPRDVNLGRVAARAARGIEPAKVAPSALDRALTEGRPAALSPRDWGFALFDLGATICTAQAPRCSVCPLAAACASRDRLVAGPPQPAARRQPAYAGSMRELRGAILRAALDGADVDDHVALRRHLAGVGAAERPGAVEAALAGLAADGLLETPPRSLSALAASPAPPASPDR